MISFSYLRKTQTGDKRIKVQKEYFTEAEFLERMKEVQIDYQKGAVV